MSPEDVASYRNEFRSPEQVASYDQHEYGPGTWSTLLWSLEQQVLNRLLQRSSFVPNRETYLDFACGTGRVTEFLAPRFQTCFGVDISPAMLALAPQRLPEATFVCTDVSTGGYNVPGSADMITSFRFMLNAEPTDRLPALKWMRKQLRDRDSRLILNNHGNLMSHKAIPYAVRRIKHPVRPTTGNVLSHRTVVRLSEMAGFQVESIHGVGYIGGRAMELVGTPRMRKIQQRLTQTHGIQRLAENQIYVLAPC